MTRRFLNLVFTDLVRDQQLLHGSRQTYARHDDVPDVLDQLTAAETEFLTMRDSFYLASIGATGWPYVQHRGGPPGFIKILGPDMFGIADYRGNRQYVSLGNFSGDNRAALFFMDYPQRARLKILARAHVVDLTENAEMMAKLTDPSYGARVERGLLFEVEAYDWNCSQHITPRYTKAEITPTINALEREIAELREELAHFAGVSPSPADDTAP